MSQLSFSSFDSALLTHPPYAHDESAALGLRFRFERWFVTSHGYDGDCDLARCAALGLTTAKRLCGT